MDNGSVAGTPGDKELDREADAVLGGAPDVIDELAHAKRMSVTAGVYRVRAVGETAVVKVISSGAGRMDWAGSDDPEHAWYWRREPALYDEGLPSAYLDADVRAPRLLARFERPDGVALWLEDVRGRPGSRWTPQDYRVAAQRLGRAQGVQPDARSEPRPWSRNFLRDYLASWDDVGWDLIDHDDAWDAPLIKAHFPPKLRRDLVRLCADRHRMIAWADQLPQTICHHDVWPNNVFAFPDHTTLIDWSFTGHGHVGGDVGNLVTDSCGDLIQPTSALPEIDAASRTGYEEGLRDAGWTGDLRQVRLGMCLMAARWCWLTPHMLRLAGDDAHRVYGSTPVDSDHLFAERAQMLDYYTVLAAEAHSLADAIGM